MNIAVIPLSSQFLVLDLKYPRVLATCHDDASARYLERALRLVGELDEINAAGRTRMTLTDLLNLERANTTRAVQALQRIYMRTTGETQQVAADALKELEI